MSDGMVHAIMRRSEAAAVCNGKDPSSLRCNTCGLLECPDGCDRMRGLRAIRIATSRFYSRCNREAERKLNPRWLG
jgi:hypothetical protein